VIFVVSIMRIYLEWPFVYSKICSIALLFLALNRVSSLEFGPFVAITLHNFCVTDCVVLYAGGM
jgi:hypothetical protein